MPHIAKSGFPIITKFAVLGAIAALVLATVLLLPSGQDDSAEAFTRGEHLPDLDIALTGVAASGYHPAGLTLHGDVVWVVNGGGDYIHAFYKSGGRYTRDSGSTFPGDMDLHSDNTDPYGLWTNGNHIWVADTDRSDAQVYVYRIHLYDSGAHASRITSREFNFHADNDAPRGIWSDGSTMWVADTDEDKVFAYVLSGGARDSAKDFDLADDNDDPAGIWGNGDFMWVLDESDDKVYVYDMSLPGNPLDAERTFSLASANGEGRGLTSDGATMWVAQRDQANSKLFAYDVFRSDIYYDIPNSNDWWSVTGTGSRVYLSNTHTPDSVRALDRSDGSEQTSENFSVNQTGFDVRGIWTDGTNVWTAYKNATQILAYRLSDGSQQAELSIPQAAENGAPTDIAGTARTLYVLDSTDTHVYAYDIRNRTRKEDAELDLATGNNDPVGIATDGIVMWVVDDASQWVYAYQLLGFDRGNRLRNKEFPLHAFNDDAGGAWFDGKYINVVERNREFAPLHRYDVEDLLLGSRVALSLSEHVIGENGGSARVVAVLGKTSTAHTTVTVTLSSNEVAVNGSAVLTIPAGRQQSSNEVKLKSSDDGVFTGNAFVNVSGTAANTSDTFTVGSVRLVVEESSRAEITRLRTVTQGVRLALNPSGNENPAGMWSDGTTAWVADSDDNKLYAYNILAGDSYANRRISAREFNLDSENEDARGVWSDGHTVWVADEDDALLYAYRMNPGGSGHGDRQESLDIQLAVMNDDPRAIWSDGHVIWVADQDDNKLYAYAMDPSGHHALTHNHGDRWEDRDIALIAEHADIWGIWSDGTTVWVAQQPARNEYEWQLRGYNLSDGTRDSALDHELSAQSSVGLSIRGLWFHGNRLFAIQHNGNGNATNSILFYRLQSQVRLELSDPHISENGGTATVTARIDAAVSSAVTVEFDQSVVGVSFSAGSLTIAADATTSAQTVTVTALDDRVFTGTRFIDIDGDASGSMELADTKSALLTILDNETLPLHDFVEDSDLSLSRSGTTGGTLSNLNDKNWSGLWVGDGLLYMAQTNSNVALPGRVTVYIGDIHHPDYGKPATDFRRDFDLDTGNSWINGLWSNGRTLWVLDSSQEHIYAYSILRGHNYGKPEPTLDIPIELSQPTSMYSDGEILWVSDVDDGMKAYRMNPGGDDHGDRVEGKDINLVGEYHVGYNGIWSDGTTMWVRGSSFTGGDGAHAYNLATKSRDPGKDLSWPDADFSTGMWSDGVTAWGMERVEVSTNVWETGLTARSLPNVTLSLSSRSVTEREGSATVTATLDRASTHETTVTISSGSEVTQDGSILTIPANTTSSTRTVTLTVRPEHNDSVFTGNRFVPVTGTTSNSDTAMRVTGTLLTIKDDETVSFENLRPAPDLDFTPAMLTDSPVPRDIWSDGTTAYVHYGHFNVGSHGIRAYVMNPGQSDHGDREPAKDIAVTAPLLHPSGGIWSDGRTVWVAYTPGHGNLGKARLEAYSIAPGTAHHGQRDRAKDVYLNSANTGPHTLWSDGEIFWVADDADRKFYAYRNNPGQSNHGERVTAREFATAGASDQRPQGAWSDGTTMWYPQFDPNRIHASNLADGAAASDRDVTFTGIPATNRHRGIWSDGKILYAVQWVSSGAHNIAAFAVVPKVTLHLSRDPIPESEGITFVYATLSEPSECNTVILVDASPTTHLKEWLAPAALHILAGETESGGIATGVGVEAKDNMVADGTRQVTISGAATNACGIIAPDDVTLSITDNEANNNPPVVENPVGDRTAVAGLSFHLAIGDLFRDPDDDVLTYSVTKTGSPLSDWLKFDAKTRVFSGLPSFADVGEFQVTVSVDDLRLGGNPKPTYTFQMEVVAYEIDRIKLVGNIDRTAWEHGRPPSPGQPTVSPRFGYQIGSTLKRATVFDTGRSGALMDQVTVELRGRKPWTGEGREPSDPAAPTLELWSHKFIDHGGGRGESRPGTKLLTFTPGGEPRPGRFSYIATDPYDLAANTTYWLVFSCPGYCPWPVAITRDDREDSERKPGWSIQNDGRLHYTDRDAWTPFSAVIKVSVEQNDYPAPELVTRLNPADNNQPFDELSPKSYMETEGTPTKYLIALDFNQHLDTASVPALSDFTLRYRGSRPPAACNCADVLNFGLTGSVAVSRNRVKLYLDAPPPLYAPMSLRYTPGANPLRSKDHGIDVEPFFEPFVGWHDFTMEVKFESSTATAEEGDGAITVRVVKESVYPKVSAVDLYATPSINFSGEVVDRPLVNDQIQIRTSRVRVPAFLDQVDLPIRIVDDRVVESFRTIDIKLGAHPDNENINGLRGLRGVHTNSVTVLTLGDNDQTVAYLQDARAKTVGGATHQVASYRVAEGQRVDIPLRLTPGAIARDFNFHYRLDTTGSTGSGGTGSGGTCADGTCTGGDYSWLRADGSRIGSNDGDVPVVALSTRGFATFLANEDADKTEGNEVLRFALAPVAATGVSVRPNSFIEVTITDVDPLPGTPTTLDATPGPQGIALAWDAVAGATGYNIERRLASETAFRRIGTSLISVYSDRTAQIDVEYVYRVQAVNSTGPGAYSDEVTVAIPPPLPAAPTNVKAILVEGPSENTPKVKITWTRSTDRYVDGYVVFRGIGGAAATELVRVGADSVEYTDGPAGLSPGNRVEYGVAAYNRNGVGFTHYVPELTVVRFDNGLAQVVWGPSRAEHDFVSLSWAPVDGAGHYQIERRRQPHGSWELIASLNDAYTSHKDRDVSSDTDYDYRIRAVRFDEHNRAVRGPWSEVYSTRTDPTPAPAPTGLTGSAPDHRSVNLDWDTSPTAVAYWVYRWKDNEKVSESKRIETPGNNSNVTVVGRNNSAYTDTDVEEGERYYYAVTAVIVNAESDYSDTLTVEVPREPPPGPPTSIEARLSGTEADRTVTITWTGSTHSKVTGYLIFRRYPDDKGLRVFQVDKAATSYTDDTVKKGKTYRYSMITKTSTAGDSEESGRTSSVVIPGVDKPDPLTSYLMFDLGSSNPRMIAHLTEGSTVNLTSGRNYGILATLHPDAIKDVKSVKFTLTDQNGAVAHTATYDGRPYSLFGANSDDSMIGSNSVFAAGEYTLRADPYPETGAGGTAMKPLEVSFTVTTP